MDFSHGVHRFCIHVSFTPLTHCFVYLSLSGPLCLKSRSSSLYQKNARNAHSRFVALQGARKTCQNVSLLKFDTFTKKAAVGMKRFPILLIIEFP